MLSSMLVVAVLPSTSAEGCSTDAQVEQLRDLEYRFDPLLAHLLPGSWAMVSQDYSRLPTIPQFWVHSADGMCPLDQFPSLLDGKTLKTDLDYTAAAWAIVQTTDEEVMGEQRFHEVVSLAKGASGADVVLVAKSPQTGAVVEWTVDVSKTGVGSATWEVLSIEEGLREAVEGWFIWPGDKGPRGEDFLDVTLTKLYPTMDGKNVRITYFTQNYANAAAAELDADHNGYGGVYAYDTMMQEWGFPSADPDNFLDVTMDGCACIYGGNQVNIHMPPNVKDWINAIGLGLNYIDAEGTAWDIVGHEFFHHFQYSIMQWNSGAYVIEGMARGTETILTPEHSHVPGSLHWLNNVNGFTYFYQNPHITPTSHWYSYGPVWGHMYDTNGIDSLRLVLEEIDVNNVFPGFIDRALAADTTGDHDNFRELLNDLGPRMAVHDLTWPKWDGSVSFNWMEHSPPVPMTTVPGPSSGVTTSASWTVPNTQPFGFRFANFPEAAGSDEALAVFQGGLDWGTGIVSTGPGGTHSATAPGTLSNTEDIRAWAVRASITAGPLIVPGVPAAGSTLHVHYL